MSLGFVGQDSWAATDIAVGELGVYDGADIKHSAVGSPFRREAAPSIIWRQASAPAAVEVRRPSAYYPATKRAMDIAGSLAALLIAAPVLAIVALLVKATSRGPVLYSHIRVGERGRQFVCYKLRTMVVDADESHHAIAAKNSHSDSRTFKIPNDPRVTAIGRWLRRLSIDEVPQLWNVLKGDMSLVGPRPPVPREVAQYRAGDNRRLLVKPGLTCIWQVSGRSRLPFPEQLEMDLEYIRSRSIWLDSKLLMQTIPAVLSTNGAY